MPDARHLIDEGVRAERAGVLDRALDHYREAIEAASDPGTQAEAYTHLADVHREQCHWDEGIAAARSAQEIARQAGLIDHLADAVIAEANVVMTRGDFAAAMPRFEEMIATTTDPRVRGIALQNMASMLAQLGRFGAAERAFQESLGNFYKAGYARGEAIALHNLGRLALDQQDPERAGPLLERALSAANQIGDAELVALASQNLASVLRDTGEIDRARDLAMSALGYFRTAQNRWREIECLRLTGEIHAKTGDHESAVLCVERALALATEIEAEVEIRVTRHLLEKLRGRAGPGAVRR